MLHALSGRSRRAAWATTLHAADLPEGPSVEGDFSAEAGAAATRELLDLADPPTAIVYANDLMAIAGLAFAVYTFANLAPRAIDHHTWYRQRFSDYPPERRALIPYLW